MNREEKTSSIYKSIKTIALCVYYIAFLAVSIDVFIECRTRNSWIGADILNSIFGAVLIVYPLNIIRYGATKTLENWIAWIVILVILIGIAKAIGEGFA